ncbi:MAG: ferredoxin--NADP reductase [Pseudomonadota bacterium]
MPQKKSKVRIDTRKWTEGRVVELYCWGDSLYSLRIEADVGPFEAGQFGQVGLVIEGEFVARPYSFINAPDERPLDFYFITIPAGPLSTHLQDLRPADRIWVAKKAAGYLTLSNVPDGEHLWLLSTGTAVGPFLSILKTEEPWRRFKKMILVHAVRTVAELAYQEVVERFREGYPEQFVMIPFVSRESCPFALGGRIPQAITDGRLEERAGIELKGRENQIMICGNPGMVQDTTKVLVETRGFRENRRKEPGEISTERYW